MNKKVEEKEDEEEKKKKKKEKKKEGKGGGSVCTWLTRVKRWSRCCGVKREAAAARMEWTFSTWTGFSLTCISQIEVSWSRDSRTPRNSTIDRSLSQYWVW